MKTLFIIALLFLLCSCDALTGEDGAPGTDGTPGRDGVANITTTELVLVSSQFSSSSDAVEFQNFGVDAITEEVVNGGLVLAYSDLGSGRDNWHILPMVLPVQGSTTTLSFTYSRNVFSVLITTDLGAPVASVFGGHILKVVVIPPAALQSVTEVDLSDLDQVLGAM